MPFPSRSDHPTELLNAAERDLIRRELSVRFGCPPALADGIALRVWRAGPLAGQPKVPAAMKSMVERELLEVSAASSHMVRAYFTEAGLNALRWLATQRRGLDPMQFAHVRRELGMGLLGAAR